MFDKTVNICFFYSIPDWYKTQEMHHRAASEDHFLIVYCPDKYKTQKMRDKAVYDSLASLKILPNWFVTTKIIKKLLTNLYESIYENIPYFIEDSGNVVFSYKEMGLLNIDLNNINRDNNLVEHDPDTITTTRLLAWNNEILVEYLLKGTRSYLKLLNL